jgi:hypothetical protein
VVVALDLPVTLLSGEVRKLRFVTGSALAELGSKYQKLAAAVPPEAMIGECLNESQVQELLRAE